MNKDELYIDEDGSISEFTHDEIEDIEKEALKKEANLRYKNSNDLLNTKIHSLFIKSIEDRVNPKKEKFAFVECDCGNEKWIRLRSILLGQSKKCGCGNNKLKTEDPEVRSIRYLMAYSTTSAKDRNLTFELSHEQVKALIFKPCHYCNSMPRHHEAKSISKFKDTKELLAPFNGLDRIDSSKGYSVENVVPCCTTCNLMKSDHSLQEFKDHIARVNTKLNKTMIDNTKSLSDCHFKYYDGMIILNDYMGSDLSVANAARVSYNKKSFEISSKDEKLIKFLAEHKHMSPFRHVQFQIILQGIPEFVLRQLYKHQVGMSYTSGDFRESATVWNEVSGRYIEFDIDFFEPIQFRPQHEKNKQASYNRSIDNEDAVRKVYQESIKAAWNSYHALLNAGVCKEQARLVLPLSFKTSVMWTASLEGLAHFVKLRNHEGAQKEIQEIAVVIEKIIRKITPICANALLGPEIVSDTVDSPNKGDITDTVDVKINMPANIGEVKQLPLI